MKFHLGGNQVIKCTLDKVYASVTNPEFMVSCIPDLISHQIHDADHFEAKMKIGISLVRGTVEMKFTLAEKQPPNHARLIGEGSGAGSKMHIESVFDLLQDGEATQMKWDSESELSGLISGIGGPLLKGQAEKQVSQIFGNVKSKLEEAS